MAAVIIGDARTRVRVGVLAIAEAFATGRA
jgi:hypothetical protein